jgi:hypothetical protein
MCGATLAQKWCMVVIVQKILFLCISDCRRGFVLVNSFIDHIQVVTTNNYITVADFHATNHPTLFFSIYTSHILATDLQ